jgi:hypothetical protein
MDAYCKEIRKLKGKFYGIEYTHVVRDKNQVADELSKLGSSRAQVPHGVFVQDLVKPSIKEEADQVVEKPPDQPLVATVPPPSTTESSLTTPVVTPQVFSSIIALHYMSISMHHFMLFHMVATNVICF